LSHAPHRLKQANPTRRGQNRRINVRAGAVRVDITPTTFAVHRHGNFVQGEAKQVSDPLHARCLVLDDGQTKIAICVVDSLRFAGTVAGRSEGASDKIDGIPGRSHADLGNACTFRAIRDGSARV